MSPSAAFGGPTPLLKVDGAVFQLYRGRQIALTAGTHTAVLQTGNVVRYTIEARGAGGGGNAGGGLSGAGGGGGAYVSASAGTFIPGKTYTITIPVGGAAGVGPVATTLVNTTDSVTIASLGSGTAGGNGSTVGVGGTVLVGTTGGPGQNGTGDGGGPNGGQGGKNGDGVTNGGAGGFNGASNGFGGGIGAGGGGAANGTTGGQGGDGMMTLTFI